MLLNPDTYDDRFCVPSCDHCDQPAQWQTQDMMEVTSRDDVSSAYLFASDKRTRCDAHYIGFVVLNRDGTFLEKIPPVMQGKPHPIDRYEYHIGWHNKVNYKEVFHD